MRLRTRVAAVAVSTLLLGATSAGAQRRPRLPPPDSAAVSRLLRVLRTGTEPARWAAAETLAAGGPDADRAIPELDRLMRRGNDRVRRPAAIALAGIGGRALPLLTRALVSRDEDVADAAESALERLSSEGRQPVAELRPLLRSPNPRIRARAVGVLDLEDYAPSAEALGALREALRDPDPTVRKEAVFAISSAGAFAAPAVPELIAVLGDTNVLTRFNAAVALGETGSPAALGALVRLMRGDPDEDVRGKAADAIGWIGPAAAPVVPALLETLGSASGENVPASAAGALGRIGLYGLTKAAVDSVVRALDRALGHRSSLVRVTAAEALYALGGPGLPSVLGAVTHDDPRVAATAVSLVARDGPDSLAVAALQRAMADPRPAVHDLAADELAGFGGDQVPRLTRLAASSNQALRAAAARGLRNIELAHRSAVAERCFEMHDLPLSWMGAGSDSSSARPIHVRFTTHRYFGPYADTTYVVFSVEALDERPGLFGRGSWLLAKDGQTVDVTWSAGYFGVTAQLAPDGDRLRGKSRTFSDDDSEPLTSSNVTGTPTPCVAPPGR